MGHLVGKDLFRKLGSKIDGLEMRAPWNDKLHAVLKELYSPEEAEVVIRMPYGLSTFEELEKATGREKGDLRRILDSLTTKGLVMDFWLNQAYQYTPSPMVIGIFEFTMMRMGAGTNSKQWARLLHEYLWGDDGSFFAANLGNGERFSQFRALPHETAIPAEEYCEVLDYEKASSLIAEAKRFSIGTCSCRHEKLHLGETKCQVPLGKCSQFDYAADLLIRHNLAREVSRSEMEDNFSESKELGLVFTADNVQKNVRFVCHCCKCCCNVLLAISEFGYPNMVVTLTSLRKSTKRPASAAEIVRRSVPSTPSLWPVTRPLKRKRRSRRRQGLMPTSAWAAAFALSSVPQGRTGWPNAGNA
jgi:hypothetical protein